MTIAENRLAETITVVAEDAAEPEQHPAAELAESLEQITGARFEIGHSPAAGKSHAAGLKLVSGHIGGKYIRKSDFVRTFCAPNCTIITEADISRFFTLVDFRGFEFRNTIG